MKRMRISHDHDNTLDHHKRSKRDGNPTKGPVESTPAHDYSRPDTPITPTYKKREMMSISFLTGMAAASRGHMEGPVRYDKVRPYHQEGDEAAVTSTLPTTPDTHTTSCHSGTERSAHTRYSWEEKFFIMYRRNVRYMTWEQIRHDFEAAYRCVTVNGLKCVYKRIRRDWGMSKVKNDSVGRERDKRVVLNFASSLSNQILRSMGFVHWGVLPGTGMITPSCQLFAHTQGIKFGDWR